MGMLNIDPACDDQYSAEIIRLARERSESIDNWFAEQRFLNEANEDSLGLSWFRNRVTIMLCEELKEMGILVNKDFDEVCDEPQLVYAVSMLRSKFDDIKLEAALKAQRSLFDDIYGDIDEDTFDRIIDWFYDNVQLDEGWQLIHDTMEEQPGIFSADEKFVENLRLICDKIDMLGEPDVATESDPELVRKYIVFLAKRQTYILEVAKKLWIHEGDDQSKISARTSILEKMVLGGFEKELGLKQVISDHIDEFSQVDLSCNKSVGEFLSKIRCFEFKRRWQHCPEFYFGDNDTACTDKWQVLMFATFIVDAVDRTDYRTEVENKLFSYEEHLGEDTVRQLIDLFRTYTKNMVDTLEINYHEAD